MTERVLEKPASHTIVRLELQVLRALAVISVVLYHLYPNLVSSGLLGVDVFFVLSGYLITSLIWRDFEHRKGRALFSELSRFWARRARRLLPAALLVLVTTFLAGLWLGPRTWWLDSSGSFFASAAYVANWYFGFEATDYLRADAAVSPYQHFWSLSVEEQFYVLWPLLVMLVIALSIRKKLNFTIALMVVLSVGSFAFAFYSASTDPGFGFYNTFTRIWEFGFGAVLALWQYKSKPTLPAKFFAISWLLLIVVMFIPHTQQTLLWQTLAAVALSVVVIIASEQKLAGPRWRSLHWVGDYSYGIYLWHWPVLILAPWVIGSSALSANIFEQLAMIALTFVLAYLSKRFLEDPIRFGRFSKLPNLTQITALLAITAALIVSFAQIERSVRQSVSESEASGEVILPGDEDPTKLIPALSQLADDKPRVEEGNYVVRVGKPGFIVSAFGDTTSNTRIALIGDSHARQFFEPIEAVAIQNKLQLDVISKTACPVQHPDDYQLGTTGGGQYCEEWNQELGRYLAANDYDLLITLNSTLIHDGKPKPTRSFVAAVTSWVEMGHNVLVVRDNPKPSVEDQISDFRYCIEQQGLDAATKCRVPKDEAMLPPDAFYREASKVTGVDTLDLTDEFCDEQWCPVIIDGMIVYRDGSHVTNTFARTLEDEFNSKIIELLGR